MKIAYIEYLFDYFSIPITKWIKWRKRKQFFKDRQPVEIDVWIERFGVDSNWHRGFTKYIMEHIELEFAVDAKLLRPTDGIGKELFMQTNRLQSSRESFLLGDIHNLIENRREIHERLPEFDISKCTIGELLDYFNEIWAKYPKKIDKVTGAQVEPETDGL